MKKVQIKINPVINPKLGQPVLKYNNQDIEQRTIAYITEIVDNITVRVNDQKDGLGFSCLTSITNLSEIRGEYQVDPVNMPNGITGIVSLLFVDSDWKFILENALWDCRVSAQVIERDEIAIEICHVENKHSTTEELRQYPKLSLDLSQFTSENLNVILNTSWKEMYKAGIKRLDSLNDDQLRAFASGEKIYTSLEVTTMFDKLSTYLEKNYKSIEAPSIAIAKFLSQLQS